MARPKTCITSRRNPATKKSSTHTNRNPTTRDSKHLLIEKPAKPHQPLVLPLRAHNVSYHYPLLLDDRTACDALLAWFEGEREKRRMPWRKEWVNVRQGEEGLMMREVAKRAYEVMVSEVMLQQTRVSTVIPYFERWILKWPTIQDLAAANHDDVLSVWKGLGYYSRATRLHQCAKEMIAKTTTPCPIPSSAEALQKFPGIGRYTAGAVSSIAFGKSEPVLDGNVSRVLSRQLGLYFDTKIVGNADMLWNVADALIKKAADHPNVETSAVPGQWNQALMELGSTICTPRPKCSECPILSTCRAYAEGEAMGAKKRNQRKEVPQGDIEDACLICAELDTADMCATSENIKDEVEEGSERPSKKRKMEVRPKNTISNYFAAPTPQTRSATRKDFGDICSTNTQDNGLAVEAQLVESKLKREPKEISAPASNFSMAYCSLFPKRTPKKKPDEISTVVCIIEARSSNTSTSDSRYLIEQRPAKGLLASLWQFPQAALAEEDTTQAIRKELALETAKKATRGDVKYIKEVGKFGHTFTHLRLTMHVQYMMLNLDESVFEPITGDMPRKKWVSAEDMKSETLSSGIRRCWEHVIDLKESVNF